MSEKVALNKTAKKRLISKQKGLNPKAHKQVICKISHSTSSFDSLKSASSVNDENLGQDWNDILSLVSRNKHSHKTSVKTDPAKKHTKWLKKLSISFGKKKKLVEKSTNKRKLADSWDASVRTSRKTVHSISSSASSSTDSSSSESDSASTPNNTITNKPVTKSYPTPTPDEIKQAHIDLIDAKTLNNARSTQAVIEILPTMRPSITKRIYNSQEGAVKQNNKNYNPFYENFFVETPTAVKQTSNGQANKNLMNNATGTGESNEIFPNQTPGSVEKNQNKVTDVHTFNNTNKNDMLIGVPPIQTTDAVKQSYGDLAELHSPYKNANKRVLFSVSPNQRQSAMHQYHEGVGEAKTLNQTVNNNSSSENFPTQMPGGLKRNCDNLADFYRPNTPAFTEFTSKQALNTSNPFRNDLVNKTFTVLPDAADEGQLQRPPVPHPRNLTMHHYSSKTDASPECPSTNQTAFVGCTQRPVASLLAFWNSNSNDEKVNNKLAMEQPSQELHPEPPVDHHTSSPKVTMSNIELTSTPEKELNNINSPSSLQLVDSTPNPPPRLRRPTPLPRGRKQCSSSSNSLSPPTMLLPQLPNITPKKENEVDLRGKKHYLVVEVVYYGRTLVKQEKNFIQRKVAELVDDMVKTPTASSTLHGQGEESKPGIHSSQPSSPLNKSDCKKELDVAIESPTEFSGDSALQMKWINEAKSCTFERNLDSNRDIPRASSASTSQNMFRLAGELQRRLSYEGCGTGYKVLGSGVGSRDYLTPTQGGCIRDESRRSDPGNTTPISIHHHFPSSDSDIRAKFQQTNTTNSSKQFQNVDDSEQQKIRTIYSDTPTPNDSLMQLMQFMNDENRSPSVTSQPRNFQRLQKHGFPMTPKCSQHRCGCNHACCGTPRCDMSKSSCCYTNTSRSEIFDGWSVASTPSTQPSTDSWVGDGEVHPRSAADNNNLPDEEREKSSNEKIQATPQPSQPATPKPRKWRQSAVSTPKEHNAWWMPKDWARERQIGAYAKTWKFEKDEDLEREKAVEVSRNANVEKIRTCNFVRL